MAATAIRLREARPDDSQRVLELANEPGARNLSFTRQPITPKRHARWYEDRLADPDTRIYLGVDRHERVVAFVRFEQQKGVCCISVCLDPEWRGQGLGPLLITKAVRKYRRSFPDALIHAYIRTENKRSRQAFQRAGFRFHSTSLIRGLEAVCYENRPADANGNS